MLFFSANEVEVDENNEEQSGAGAEANVLAMTTTTPTAIASFTPSNLSKRKKTKNDPIEEAMLQYIKNASNADEEHQFCLSIAASLRKLQGLHKSTAKLRIQQVVYECECAQHNEAASQVQNNQHNYQNL